MLFGITVLLVYQTIGEILARLLGLPIPGPVVGMLLLFVTLWVCKSAPADLRETAQGILQHLSLLFVPAGVGVMIYFNRVGEEWLPILASAIGATVITLAVTALTMQRLMRGRTPGTDGSES